MDTKLGNCGFPRIPISSCLQNSSQTTVDPPKRIYSCRLEEQFRAREVHMEPENPRVVEENRLPKVHAIRFQVGLFPGVSSSSPGAGTRSESDHRRKLPH